MIHLAEIDQINGRLKAKNKGETLLHIALKFKNTHEFIKEYLSKHPKGRKRKIIQRSNTFTCSYSKRKHQGCQNNSENRK